MKNYLLGALVLMAFTIALQQKQANSFQAQLIELQKVQMKQDFHRDLGSLLSSTNDDGFKNVFSGDVRELSAREDVIVALFVQRAVLTKDLRPIFTDTEWEAMLKDVRDSFKLPIFQNKWNQIKVYYDQATVEFVEQSFLSKG